MSVPLIERVMRSHILPRQNRSSEMKTARWILRENANMGHKPKEVTIKIPRGDAGTAAFISHRTLQRDNRHSNFVSASQIFCQFAQPLIARDLRSQVEAKTRTAP